MVGRAVTLSAALTVSRAASRYPVGTRREAQAALVASIGTAPAYMRGVIRDAHSRLIRSTH